MIDGRKQIKGWYLAEQYEHDKNAVLMLQNKIESWEDGIESYKKECQKEREKKKGKTADLIILEKIISKRALFIAEAEIRLAPILKRVMAYKANGHASIADTQTIKQC